MEIKDVEMLMKIVQLLYFNTGIRALLEEAVKKSGTKIDDIAFTILDKILCPDGNCVPK